jgi:hypothetical protein
MEYWLDLSIVGLAALVHATLQLGVGSLVLLYHESARKHVQKTTKSLVSSFMAGIGAMVFLGLASTAFVITNFFGGGLVVKILAAVIGLLVALAVTVWCFYYRAGSTSELWLPRSVAEFIDMRARMTESNTEAFSLGVLAYIGELPFVLILSVVAGNSLADLPELWRPVGAAIYTLIAILPLIVVRAAAKTGKTAQMIQKWRLNNQTFLIVVSGLGFATLGAFIFAFRVLGN